MLTRSFERTDEWRALVSDRIRAKWSDPEYRAAVAVGESDSERKKKADRDRDRERDIEREWERESNNNRVKEGEREGLISQNFEMPITKRRERRRGHKEWKSKSTR